MSRDSELTVEEKAVLEFLETSFEKHGMRCTLAMLRNVDTDNDDLRALIDVFQHLYQMEKH